MVSYVAGRIDAAAAPAALVLAAAAEKAKPLLERLDPPNRARVLMALLALVLVGAGLVLATIVGGRYLRKIARQTPAKTPRHEDDWYRKPLIPDEPERPSARDPE
jgi:hypothetical protein